MKTSNTRLINKEMNKGKHRSLFKRKSLLRSILFLGVPVGITSSILTNDYILFPIAIVLAILLEILLMNKN